MSKNIQTLEVFLSLGSEVASLLLKQGEVCKKG